MIRYWKVAEYFDAVSSASDPSHDEVHELVRYYNFKTVDVFFCAEAYETFEELKDSPNGAVLLQSEDGLNWIEFQSTRPSDRITYLEGRVSELERLIESIGNG